MESGWKIENSDLSIENDENGDGATKPKLADDRMIHPKLNSNTSNIVIKTGKSPDDLANEKKIGGLSIQKKGEILKPSKV